MCSLVHIEGQEDLHESHSKEAGKKLYKCIYVSFVSDICNNIIKKKQQFSLNYFHRVVKKMTSSVPGFCT